MKELSLPFFTSPLPPYTPARQKINDAYRLDEAACVQQLVHYLDFSAQQQAEISVAAKQLVLRVRAHQVEVSDIEKFLHQYDLAIEEGVLLMCLAEALLRIPDKETEKLLLQDKLTSANWEKHLGKSESSFVNMATWGLALSGKILNTQKETGSHIKSIWHTLIRRSSEPLIRKAVRKAMKILSQQFVVGESMVKALKASAGLHQQGYTFSYDMLGEVARTRQDADRYYNSYLDAISVLGRHQPVGVDKQASISVKLSALHPLYNFPDRDTVVPYLIKRLKELLLHAKDNQVYVTIDAEEADRLELSLDIFAALFADNEFSAWEGLGLALQAYQRRAFYVLDWLIELAQHYKKRIPVRLVKGAYWDSEIKSTQVGGFKDYPVFTRKNNTDISYLASAKKMLTARGEIYSQFATHNAYSVAAILNMLGTVEKKSGPLFFEFQSLFGMGRALHNELVAQAGFNLPCRIYAPVGASAELLPYLVRRLLENGANSSFVNRINDPLCPLEKLVQSPLDILRETKQISNPNIPLPMNLYAPLRKNSMGVDLSDREVLQQLAHDLQNKSQPTDRQQGVVTNPADRTEIVGFYAEWDEEKIITALHQAQGAFIAWSQKSIGARADILRKAADLYEHHRGELIYLAIKEGGKTVAAAVAEVREAVDFCRYYALEAERQLTDTVLPGPTGELNVLKMEGRGVVACISPWNFPLAIFTGQVVSALVTGNCVLAKPSKQTPLIARLAVSLLHQAGVPKPVLSLVLASGKTVGKTLLSHPDLAGILFTGSNDTANSISLQLANRKGPIVPFVAETGGINAMVADSSALHEQLVRDVLISAFDSAGQRCSALRLLCVQEDVLEAVLRLLKGAMAELNVGNPLYLKTHVGPVIDAEAKQQLEQHLATMMQEATLIYQVKLPESTANGTFVPPTAFLLNHVSQLKKEVFGPILHVVSYKLHELDEVIDAINALGFGLTFGIQSRIQSTIAHIQSRIKAGNIYVNRNMIGAIVGTQPFGGSRLSGTGPKAGGPHYLLRLCNEVTVSMDTTAVGGNASLMAMEE